MSDDLGEGIFTVSDPAISVSITHNRDQIVFGGKLEQDYRWLTYLFADPAGDVEARMYLDDTPNVSIISPLHPTPVPEHILYYLQRRFESVDQLGGSEGRVEIWVSRPSKKPID